MAKKAEAASEEAKAASAQTQAAGRQIELVDEGADVCYANFCRVNGTPEELIIDFGLNTHPMGAQNEKLQVDQRVVVNFYTAKRLLAALQVAMQRHEAAFGVLETNVQKRLVPEALRAMQNQQQQAAAES